jgi:hypothetical protein
MRKFLLAAAIAAVAFCAFRNAPAVPNQTPALADTTKGLPKSYAQRHFMSNLSGSYYSISDLAGNLCVLNPKDTSYEIKTLKAVTKGGKSPVTQTIRDGAIYYGIVTPATSFNGSRVIGGITAHPKEIIQIGITDVAKSFVPDSLMDIGALNDILKQVPADQLKNLYYIKSVTLTHITSKPYSESKFNLANNAFYIIKDGKTYMSAGPESYLDQVISVFLIPLSRIKGDSPQ